MIRCCRDIHLMPIGRRADMSEANGYLDFFIDRPLAKGYILNTSAEGVINNNGEQFVCRHGDILLFPPGGVITMDGRHPDASEWAITSRFISGLAYWREVADTAVIFCPNRFRPDEARGRISANVRADLISAGRGGRIILSYWRSICWSSCCSDVWRGGGVAPADG